MGFAELAAVAFIKDKHHAFIPQMRQMGFITFFGNCVVELLDGGDDQFGVVRELADQRPRIVGDIHAIFLKAVKLLHGLVVKVLAVHHKHYLENLRHLRNNLAGLKRGECLAGSGRMPDISVFFTGSHPLDNGFRGIALVGSEYHQDFVGLVVNDVFCDHFAQMVRVQKCIAKIRQVCDVSVFCICPEEGLSKRLKPIIGVILGVDPV